MQTAGTVGYACPHYIRTGIVCEASEVYAFGMVLLELLTAQPPAVQLADKTGFRFIVNEIKYSVEEVLKKLDVSADWHPVVARELAEKAIMCIQPEQGRRPKMPYLVTELRKLDKKAGELGSGTSMLSYGSYGAGTATAYSYHGYGAPPPGAVDGGGSSSAYGGVGGDHSGGRGDRVGGYGVGGSSSTGSYEDANRLPGESTAPMPGESSSKRSSASRRPSEGLSRQPSTPSHSRAIQQWREGGKLLISGMRVNAKWKQLMMCAGTIKRVNENGSCDIKYDDGDFEERVPASDVDPVEDDPNPAIREVIAASLRAEEEAARAEQEQAAREAAGLHLRHFWITKSMRTGSYSSKMLKSPGRVGSGYVGREDRGVIYVYLYLNICGESGDKCISYCHL